MISLGSFTISIGGFVILMQRAAETELLVRYPYGREYSLPFFLQYAHQ